MPPLSISLRTVCASGALTALLLASPPGSLGAQVPEPDEPPGAPLPESEQAEQAGEASDWNSPRALELANRAIFARRYVHPDTVLRNFQARAEGHVYYLAEFGGRRQVVRADQVALEIMWQAPDRALQTIVGRRFEKRLPSRVQYHIDHLAVVLDNFGDRIRIGEGDEVRDVLHPAAPGAPRRYDYRLADSLEIQVRDRITRVYRLQVRPADAAADGLVGSIFVDRRTGAIARLRGTFTASSYVDPQLDYVSVDLRSALWEGRWWLPAEQTVEVRREVQWLDMPAGGVIRTEMRILDYEINTELPYALAAGERVATLPADRLRAYDAWRSELYEGRVRALERTPEGLNEMMAEARELVGPSALLAAAPFRAYLPDASAALRVRRAEGLLLGWGGSVRIDAATSASAWVGWPFARERPQAELGLERQVGSARLRLRLLADRLADVGPFPAAPGFISTIGVAVDGEDWTDPYFESGIELGASAPLAGGDASLSLFALRQRSGRLEAGPIGGGTARAVRPIDEGTLTGIAGSLVRPLGDAAGADWWLRLRAESGLDGPGDFGFARVLATAEADGERLGSPWGWGARLALGAGTGELPAQRLFLLGGRGTLPGYPFRGWAGDRVALLRGQVSRELLHPWLTGRLLGAAGWTHLGGPGAEAAGRFDAAATRAVRGSAGLGVGLFYDVLRLELSRGLGSGGGWELVVSISPALGGML